MLRTYSNTTRHEQDWINSRETIDEDHPPRDGDDDDDDEVGSTGPGAAGESASSLAAAIGGPGGKKKKGGAARLQYIPVPDDPVLANSVCPICQERFETRWLDDAQEFVWPDALRLGARVYHASCHREATQDEGGGGGGGMGVGVGVGGTLPLHHNSRGTPEPVLGKRKAEDDITTLRGKPKIEAA